MWTEEESLIYIPSMKQTEVWKMYDPRMIILKCEDFISNFFFVKLDKLENN